MESPIHLHFQLHLHHRPPSPARIHCAGSDPWDRYSALRRVQTDCKTAPRHQSPRPFGEPPRLHAVNGDVGMLENEHGHRHPECDDLHSSVAERGTELCDECFSPSIPSNVDSEQHSSPSSSNLWTERADSMNHWNPTAMTAETQSDSNLAIGYSSWCGHVCHDERSDGSSRVALPPLCEEAAGSTTEREDGMAVKEGVVQEVEAEYPCNSMEHQIRDPMC